MGSIISFVLFPLYATLWIISIPFRIARFILDTLFHVLLSLPRYIPHAVALAASFALGYHWTTCKPYLENAQDMASIALQLSSIGLKISYRTVNLAHNLVQFMST
jgi:hypothetical protein